MQKPRIVFGMNSAFAVRHFLPEIACEARKQGFDVFIAAPKSEAPLVGFPEAEYLDLPLNREISPLADLVALWRLWRLLRRVRPQVTNMSTPKMALLGGLAAWLAGVPHRIYTLRGLRYETTRLWKRAVLVACEKIACACAHQVISISRSVKEVAVADRLAREEKVLVLGDRVSEGVDFIADESPTDPPAELRQKLGIPPAAPVVGFVGRLTRDKGVPELVESHRILRSEGYDAHLLLAGDFESGDPVDTATVNTIRNDPSVHWLGYVQTPRSYYSLMDVFVFPTHREGLGKVLMEAAAAGKPVVATATTGVVDVVQDGITGILVPPRDAHALARATGYLLRHPEIAARMGEAGRTLMREQFDNTIYLHRLGTVLRSCTEDARISELPPKVQGPVRRSVQ